MYRAPHKCCICGEKLTVTRLTCDTCGTTLEGQFDGCPFCSLSPEETRFLLIFLKNRGSIKDVEREMGISYPTVRNLLDNLLSSLALDGGTPPAPNAPTEEPRRRSRSTEGDTAKARRDILARLSRHEITADEAARRLRELE